MAEVIPTVYRRPIITASVDRPGILTRAATPVKVEGGNVLLDSHAYPYAQGTVEVPFDDEEVLDDLDPRDSVRVLLSAAANGHYVDAPPAYSTWTESRRNHFKEPVPATTAMYGTNPGRIAVTFITDASGNYARGTVNTAGSAYFNFTGAAQRVACAPGQTVGISAETRIPAGGFTGRLIRAYWINSAGAIIGPAPDGATQINVDGWARHSVTAGPAPAGTAYVGFYLLGTPSATVGWVMDIRRVMLELGPVTLPYFDGDTTDVELAQYQWTGTANASASTEQTRTLLPPGPPSYVSDDTRTFDLGLRSREVDHAAKIIRCRVTSDESRLMDYAPLADDLEPLNRQTSLAAVCDYVLGKATGNTVPTSSPWLDAGGMQGYASGGTSPAFTVSRLVTGSVATPTPWYWRLLMSGGTGPFSYFGIRNNTTDNRAPVTAGKTYSGRVMVHTNTAKRVSYHFEFRDAALAVVGSPPWNALPVAQNQWQTAIIPPTVAPAGAVWVSIDVRMYLDAPAVNDQINVTDFKIAAGNTPPSSLSGRPADADITRYWAVTNHVTNPNATTNADDWATSTNSSTLTPSTISSPAPPQGTRAMRYTAVAAGTAIVVAGGYSTASAKTNGVRIIPGKAYCASAQLYTGSSARAGTVGIQFRDAGGNVLTTTWGADVPGSNAFTLCQVDNVKAPQNAVSCAVLARSQNNTAGQLEYVTNVMLSDGGVFVPFFDGATTDTAQYGYDWTGTANLSGSTRTPTIDAPYEALIWKAGVTAWDFLEPLTSQASLRLFCDEKRVWRLINPYTYAIAGNVNVSGFNATEGSDTISRDDAEVFCTGVVVRYTWIDPISDETLVRTDAAGTPDKVFVVDYARPYPGVGAAAAILKRRNGTGRTQDVTALVNFLTTPAQLATITLPAAPTQQGPVTAVDFALDDTALMGLVTGGLIDIPPGSWLSTAKSEKWTDPPAATWAEWV